MHKLSLLIPIFNEEDNIAPLIQALLNVAWTTPVELVFVNDCSTDNTSNVLKHTLHSFALQLEEKKICYNVIEHTRNQGKGAGIHTAIRGATGTILIVQDADSEYDPSEIPGIIQPIIDNKADVVFGSRFKETTGQAHRTYHFLVNRALTVFSNLLSGLYLTDMETCYKAFRREILANIKLQSKRFGFEPEVTAHLARLKARVWEVPVSYYPRSYMEGKKITWKDGIAAFWHILYFNWLVSPSSRFSEALPPKYIFKKWSERYTGHSGKDPVSQISSTDPKQL